MNKNRLAFIFHPLNLSTAEALITHSSIADSANKDRANFKKNLEFETPFIFSEVHDLVSVKESSIDFVSIVCPLLPEQLIVDKEKSIRKVLECLELAEATNCNFAVLAGFTSIATNQGKDLIGKTKIVFTTGNTYTASLAISSIYKACKILEYEIKDLKCTVIGASGDIGRACVKSLMGRVSSLSLCIRDSCNADQFLSSLHLNPATKVEIHKKIDDAVYGSDIVISAASSLTTIIDPIMIKPGAIICDVALPPSIAREISEQRDDLLIYEGGLAAVPSFQKIANSKWNFWWHQNAVYGCLAEGMILSHANQLDFFSIGKGEISTEKMGWIMDLGNNYGFDNSDFFCGNRVYKKEDFLRISQAHEVGNQITN